MLNFTPTREQELALEGHERVAHLLSDAFKAFVASEKALAELGVPAPVIKEIRASAELMI